MSSSSSSLPSLKREVELKFHLVKPISGKYPVTDDEFFSSDTIDQCYYDIKNPGVWKLLEEKCPAFVERTKEIKVSELRSRTRYAGVFNGTHTKPEHIITAKSSGGMSRDEVEMPVTSEVFEELNKLALVGKRIVKLRIVTKLTDKLSAEVDIFAGHLDGLIVIEVEYDEASTSRNEVERAIRERFTDRCEELIDVTEDKRFKNANLALAHPDAKN